MLSQEGLSKDKVVPRKISPTMRHLVILVLFVELFISSAFAQRCEGSPYCIICTDCSKCEYCSVSGNHCGVCKPSEGEGGARPATFKYKKESQSSAWADIDGDGKPEKLVTIYWGSELVTLTVLDQSGSVIAGSLTEHAKGLKIDQMVRPEDIADIDGNGRDEIVHERPGRGPNPWLNIHSWDNASFITKTVRLRLEQSVITEEGEYLLDAPLQGFNYFVQSARNYKDGVLLKIKPYNNGSQSYEWSRTALFRTDKGKLKLSEWTTPWTHQRFSSEPHAEGFILPAVHFRPVREDELANLSPRQLTLLRNEIYALYGRKFSDKELRSYYTATKWYAPDQFYQEDQVPQFARDNAQLIMRYQKKANKLW